MSEPSEARPHTTMSAGEYAGHLARVPVRVVQQVLPDSPVPVALAAGALALGGLIEWPVAGAIGLGYLAVRRWR